MWEGVRTTVNADKQRAYKEHKHVVKRHFIKVGGYEDVETTRNNPLEDVDNEPWNELIDELFSNECYMNQSEKGKECRDKLPHTSVHGSRSYTNRRYIEVIKFISII